MKQYRGVFHVHSNYSYDGHHSLQELKTFFLEQGFSFALMSEHSDTFSKARMLEYVSECHLVSSDNFLLIPGIEYSCKHNLHIIGVGVSAFTESQDPQEVIKFIRRHNGISILAHPVRYSNKVSNDILQSIDGIEVWNAAYDGRFIPNASILKLWLEAKKKHPTIVAYGGLDLHVIRDVTFVRVECVSNSLTKESVLGDLKQGCFSISNSFISLSARNGVSKLKLATCSIFYLIYAFINTIKKAVL